MRTKDRHIFYSREDVISEINCTSYIHVFSPGFYLKMHVICCMSAPQRLFSSELSLTENERFDY